MSLSPEELLEWAAKVEHAEFGWSLDELFKSIPFDDKFVPAVQSVPLVDCGCPKYGICMNTACPRAVRVTNMLNTPHGRAFEDWSYPLR